MGSWSGTIQAKHSHEPEMHLIIFIADALASVGSCAMKCISGPCKCFACIVPDHYSQSEWAGLQTNQ